MLISQKMAFVELHKGGSARVQKLLGEIGGGEVPGKVPTSANELVALDKPVIGYLCDPLAYYLNLWKSGCEERGELYRRLTDRSKWNGLLTKRAARIKAGAVVPAGKAIPEGWGAEHAAKVWYSKAEEPAAFREWLHAVVATRGIRRLIHQTYAASPLQRMGGLMTYEYFLSFVRDSENFDKFVDTAEKLKALNAQKCITTHFIKSETAGADFLRIMGELGMPVSDGQQHTISAWDKDHEAFRELEFSTYYDAESRRLVLKRERFICEAFGYHVGETGGGAEESDDDDDDDGDKPGGGKPGKGGKGLGKGGAGKGGKGKNKGQGGGGGGKGKNAGKKNAGAGAGAAADDDDDEGGAGAAAGGGDDENDSGAGKPKLTPEQRLEKREARQAARSEARQAAASATAASGGDGDGDDGGSDGETAAGGGPAPRTAAAKKTGGKSGGQGGGKAAAKAAGGKPAGGKSAEGKGEGGKAAGKPAGKTAGKSTGKAAGKASGKPGEKGAARNESRGARQAGQAGQAGGPPVSAPGADAAPDASPDSVANPAATDLPPQDNGGEKA